MQNLADFPIRAGAYTQSVQGGFEGIYEQGVNDVLRGTGKETFEADQLSEEGQPGAVQAGERRAVSATDSSGDALLQIAQLIKAGVGLEVAFTDVGGWDTHRGQGGARGQLANLLAAVRRRASARSSQTSAPSGWRTWWC